MSYVRIDSYDGEYHIDPLNPEQEAICRSSMGNHGFEQAYAYVQQSVLDAYHRHCDEHDVWRTLWRTLRNQTHQVVKALENKQ